MQQSSLLLFYTLKHHQLHKGLTYKQHSIMTITGGKKLLLQIVNTCIHGNFTKPQLHLQSCKSIHLYVCVHIIPIITADEVQLQLCALCLSRSLSMGSKPSKALMSRPLYDSTEFSVSVSGKFKPFFGSCWWKVFEESLDVATQQW